MREMAALPAGSPRRVRLRQDLVIAFLPVVDNLARKHCGGNRDVVDDLTQTGTIALITAIDRWDPHLASGEFLGYLIPCVRGEMLRWFRDRTWSTRVPRRLKDLSGAITQVSGPLAQELGRSPRPGDLAARLSCDVGEIIDALAAAESRRAHSLDAADASGGSTPSERWGAPDAAVDAVDNRAALHGLLAVLPERERRILVLRFVDELTQTQIAQQVGVSQMHVSRLLAQVLARLRRGLADPPDDTPAAEPSAAHPRGRGLRTAAAA